MKILLAVDGSDYTKRMLAWLAAHDEMFAKASEYHVLTVVTAIPRDTGYFELGDPKAYYRDQAEPVLRPVRAFVAQQGWHASFEQREGHPAEVVAEVAAQGGFDIIVLGSHGHSALGNLVLGSVATGVLARCKVPVLVIR